MPTITMPRTTAALHDHARPATTVVLAARCCIPAVDTACDCGGLLAYVHLAGRVGGAWVHVDQCTWCLAGGPCPRPHVGCTAPEPRRCLHRGCDQPVRLAEDGGPLAGRCALDGADDGCCGCCWDLE